MGSSGQKEVSQRGGRGLVLSFILLLVVVSSACDDLLEVELPGDVVAADLEQPRLAETLVLSAQGDFECGFVDYMLYPGQWYEEWLNTSASRPDALSGLRSLLIAAYVDPCDSGTGPLWTPIQVGRQQARRAQEIITPFDPALVANKDFLLAKAALYEAYGIQLLGEQFCGITLDGGPELTRNDAFDRAITEFDEVIAGANAAIAAGQQVAEATAIRNAAYVGRARARLNRGNDMAGVVADASLVPSGFQYLATYDDNPGRRRNRIHERNNRGDAEMPHQDYTDLTIDPATGLTFTAAGEPLQGAGTGTADPRVTMTAGPEDEPRGFLLYRRQQKYIGDGADIPFATWREAQLMIAEAQQGQQAIDIVNMLRSSTVGLPAGIDSGAWPLPPVTGDATTLTAAQIETLVREERRRELWMQGVQAGDKLRWGYPAWDAEDEYGQALGPGACIPIPFLEQTSNPNL